MILDCSVMTFYLLTRRSICGDKYGFVLSILFLKMFYLLLRVSQKLRGAMRPYNMLSFFKLLKRVLKIIVGFFCAGRGVMLRISKDMTDSNAQIIFDLLNTFSSYLLCLRLCLVAIFVVGNRFLLQANLATFCWLLNYLAGRFILVS